MQQDLKHQLGHALRKIRPGLSSLTSSRFSGFLGFGLRVSSSEFGEMGAIPVRFTGDGEGVSPPLHWEGLPPDTESVVVLCEDADVPSVKPLVHVIVHSIPPDKTSFEAGEIPRRLDGFASTGWGCGRNSIGRPGWTAPNPPPGHGPHQYAFQVFALNTLPRFPYPPGRSLLIRTIRPHLIGQGRTIGTYTRA